VIALVAVGVTVRRCRTSFSTTPYLVAGLLVLLLIAFAGPALVSRRLRRQTRGLDADSINQMYSPYQAVLHSLPKGLLVVDRAKRSHGQRSGTKPARARRRGSRRSCRRYRVYRVDQANSHRGTSGP